MSSDVDDALDALVDGVMARLFRKPAWRALQALAAKHFEELVSLAREEEAKQPDAEAIRRGAKCVEDAPLFTLTVGQFSALLARAIAAGASEPRHPHLRLVPPAPNETGGES